MEQSAAVLHAVHLHLVDSDLVTGAGGTASQGLESGIYVIAPEPETRITAWLGGIHRAQVSTPSTKPAKMMHLWTCAANDASL